MRDIQSQVADIVADAQKRIAEVVTAAVSAGLSGLSAQAIVKGAKAVAKKSAPATSTPKSKKTAPAKAKPAKPAAKKGGGVKRSPEELAEITEQAYNYIKSNPNQGVEQIKAALKRETSALVLPLRKLVAEGRVKTTGAKRATKYLPK